MTQTINTEKALEGTPRPHHLRGDAVYQQKGNKYELKGTAYFSSEHPSIGDRSEKYLANPHVNSGDLCFAVWNAAHIIGDRLGYKQRTLVDEVRVKPIKPIPPDTELSLEVRIEERSETIDRNNKPYTIGRIEAKLYQNKVLLAEVYADAFARKN
jgi:hypothetical protein